MKNILKEFIRLYVDRAINEEKDDEMINDTEEIEGSEDEIQSEFCSVGGAGAIGQFGWAAPLGSKSNAKSVEKRNKKSSKNKK